MGDRGVYSDLLGRKFRPAEDHSERQFFKRERISQEQLSWRQRVVGLKTRDEQLRELAQVQASRPLKPPGR